MKPPFDQVAVSELRVTDERDYRTAGLDLLDCFKGLLEKDRVRFLIPRRATSWDRTTFLNLTFWSPSGGDLLERRALTGDQLCHVAWHHLASRKIGSRTADAKLLAEAIASAFDLYLTGTLLVRAPRAAFLEEQVPRMAERAKEAGLSRAAFGTMLARVAARPERAFESLRQLLYDCSRSLLPKRAIGEAAAAIERATAHPYFALLHHYELSNWLLHTRATASLRPSRRAAELDRRLRSADRPLQELCQRWGVLHRLG